MAKKKITPEQIAGLGLVGIIGYFLLTNGSKMIDAISGGGSGIYSGYSGSGTDLSQILPFLQETPPTFNITNPDIPSNFFINPDTVLTKKDVTTAETTAETTSLFGDKTTSLFGDKRTPLKTVGNTTDNNIINMFNPNYWLGSIGQNLPDDEYKLRQENNSKFALFRSPTEFINAGVNPIGFLINRFSSSGSGGGGGGCSGGTCKKDYNTTPAEIPFNIDLTTPNLNKPLVYGGNNTETAGVYIASLRSQNKTNGLSVWGDNPVLTRTGENTYLVTNSQNLGKYYDYSKKEYVTDFSNVERAIQSDQALKLAGGNCGSAVVTNQCTGVKKTVSYGNTPSSTTRYYENTGTSLTRSDLRVDL